VHGLAPKTESRHGPILILVCFAVREEAQFFRVPAEEGESIRVVVTGMGAGNAAPAVERALRARRQDLVLTCGFAGGLRPGLAAGTVVFAEDGAAGLGGTLSRLGALPGRFHCSSRIACTAREKEQLYRETGADAVEMESEAVRQLCRARNVPSATIRVVSDPAEEDLPLNFNALMNERCELQYGKLACAVLREPGSIARLIRFGGQTRRAALKLAQTLQDLLRCVRDG
jgi:adenosylhomocysteine nucleosidase